MIYGLMLLFLGLAIISWGFRRLCLDESPLDELPFSVEVYKLKDKIIEPILASQMLFDEALGMYYQCGDLFAYIFKIEAEKRVAVSSSFETLLQHYEDNPYTL